MGCLTQSIVALVTTTGVHLRDQEPYNVEGDNSWRIVPGDTTSTQLMVTHDHYDHYDADQDVTYLPIEWEGFYTVADVGRVPPESVVYPLERMLSAAFTSLSSSAPHSHECQRSDKSFLRTVPHELHS